MCYLKRSQLGPGLEIRPFSVAELQTKITFFLVKIHICCFLSLLRITKHDIPKGLGVVVVILVVVIVDIVAIVVVDWTHVLGPEMKFLKSVSIVAPLFR